MKNLPVAVNWESELKGAAALMKSGLAPRDIRTPEAALFVIMAGRDLGLSAVQSLRSIRPVMGKVECSADLQLSLFHRSGGKSRWRKLTDNEVELELHAHWLVEPHISRWTMEDAKRAGLASGENWKKYPKAMLRSRAITAGLKDIGYLEGSGVYAPGEISGQEVVDVQTGELLPTSDQQASEMAQLPKPQQVAATDGALAGLEEEAAMLVLEWAEKINGAWLAKDPDQAYALYKDAKEALQGNADSLVALRKELPSQCRTTLRQMSDDELRQSIKIGVPKEPDSDLPITIADVNALIRGGKYDEARDMARGFDAATRLALINAINAAALAREGQP